MSLTIIDKSKKSPYFVWTPRPTFRSLYEEQKYFEGEKKKWIEGDGDVPGSLYFYLKEGFIKHRVIPQGHDSVERPMPRIASLWMHQAFNATRKKKKVQLVFKGRGVGLSSEMGAMAIYQSKVFPGSNTIVTSKDQDGIAVFFQEKIYVPYQHLDARIRPDEIKRNNTKSRCYLELGVNHIGNDGLEQYSRSTINLRETTERPDSPQNFSGQGAALGLFDELPLHPRKEKLLDSSIECFRNPFTKELDGFLLGGGTFEDSMSQEDIEGFRQLVANKDLWDCEILFVPFWWSFDIDANGYPNKKKAFEWWDKQYEKLSSSEAKQRAFVRNNPRTLDDIFENVKGGRWEEETEEIIRAQKKAVLEADVPCPKYTFINLGGAVTPELSKKGSIWMIEPVKPNCTYILGVDGVGSDTETGGKEGSEMAGVIIKMFDPTSDPFMPVAIHSERPKTIEGGYRKLINLAIYYNQYQGFQKIWAEANMATASHFGNFLITEGYKRWISMRKDLSGKGWIDTKKMFQYRTPDHIAFQYKQANIFLRRYAHSIQMMPLIDQLLLPKNMNADILDAWLQFFTAMPNFDQATKPKPVPKPRTALTMVWEDGKTVLKQIPI